MARGSVHQHEALAIDLLVGAIAGAAATVAMTLAATAMHRRLPASEQYPLPPRELTQQVVDVVLDDASEPGMVAATLVSHVGFGAVVGGLFGLLRLGRTSAPGCCGVLYGLGVWVASYLGWIPASQLLRPATDHPARRNILMLVAHVVWGATLDAANQGLRSSLPLFREGAFKDR